MVISIDEALKLEKFKDFRVLAGKRGLLNKIKKVGILDYETNDMIVESFEAGEFVITTLLVIKDNPKMLYEIIKKLILSGASGLAIKDIYFKNISDEVISLANNNEFPIIMFSTVLFEDVIIGINDIINAKKEEEFLELKIDNILYGNLNKTMIKRIAYEINGDFREKNVAVFCKLNSTKEKKLSRINFSKQNHGDFYNFTKVSSYKDGYMIIFTFESLDENKIKDIILRRLYIMGINKKNYRIGISNLHGKLEEIDCTIKESLYSFKYVMAYKKNISFFSDIGINKILLPLIDNIWMQKYYNEIIEPILKYDSRNDTELINTAVVYVDNNGNIKATAEEMHQHSNTIRYRIDKIYSIMGGECDSNKCYEELAVVIKIHKLFNSGL